MERIDICKLCFEEFGDELRPRGLHCGHSYCTGCLDKLVENGNLSCPKCKKNHQVASAKDFSINYDLEESLSYSRMTQAHVATKAQTSTKFTKLQKLISEQKDSIHSLTLSADDVQSQLQDYDEFLLKENKKHEEVLQKIHDLANLHEIIIKEIKEERNKVKDMKNEGQGCGKEVKDKLPTLDNATSNRTAAVAVADIVECTDDLEGWIERCRHEFPFPKITFSQQVLEESMDALALVVSKWDENDPVASSSSSYDNDLTILEKVTNLGDKSKLTVEKLRSQPSHWKNRIAAGRVYACSSSNGRKRFANLSERDGKIYLHYLQDKEAPPLSYIIEHSELLASLDAESAIVFLDLAWAGATKGRVLIRLSSGTPYGQQFRILCTGDLGPSYANSKFELLHDKGTVHECIAGGNYDGKGGSSIVEGLNTSLPIYTQPNVSGIVWAFKYIRGGDGNHCAKFVINTGKGEPDDCYNGVFGQVIEGLCVVREASQVDIKTVEMIDCGVVIPI